MSLAHDDLSITFNNNTEFVTDVSVVLLRLLTLPPIPTDIKTESFIYTSDKLTLKSANKFQCEDLHKKDSLYNKKNDLVILVSTKKSKDGKEYIGRKVKNETINYVYLAYTDGKPEVAPIKQLAISLLHFLKCLVDHDISLLRLGIENNDFGEELNIATGFLLSTASIL